MNNISPCHCWNDFPSRISFSLLLLLLIVGMATVGCVRGAGYDVTLKSYFERGQVSLPTVMLAAARPSGATLAIAPFQDERPPPERPYFGHYFMILQEVPQGARELIADQIRNTGLFSGVTFLSQDPQFPEKSASCGPKAPADFIMTGVIRNFGGYYERKLCVDRVIHDEHGLVDIALCIRRARTGAVVWKHEFRTQKQFYDDVHSIDTNRWAVRAFLDVLADVATEIVRASPAFELQN